MPEGEGNVKEEVRGRRERRRGGRGGERSDERRHRPTVDRGERTEAKRRKANLKWCQIVSCNQRAGIWPAVA